MDDFTEEKFRRIVNQFLNDFKNLVLDKSLYIHSRQNNRDALLDLGLTAQQREEIILSLSVADYCSGPEKDKYKPGYYWVFGKKIDNAEIYIKLKISEYQGEEYPICFSFHGSEHPLKYLLVD